MSERRRYPERCVAARVGATAVLVASALLVTGCFGRGLEPKQPGSAIWLARDSGPLDRATQTQLASVGLTDLFVDAGELAWGATVAVERDRLPQVPIRTPVTLALRGVWSPRDRDALDVASDLARELQAVRIEAEQGGLLVVGFHFRVDAGDRGSHFAKTLAALRRKLGGKEYLSVGFDRRKLEDEDAKDIARAADFVTCFLYGQMPGEKEDPTAWDLQAVERSFHRLEALGRPYFTGAVTIGAATFRTRGEGNGRIETHVSLGEIVRDRRLELRPGFSLEGVDRQVYEFVAGAPVTVAGQKLARGDSVRLVRTTTALMEEFRRMVGAWESSKRLGDLFYRLPQPEEKLSLSAENLTDVLGPGSSQPEIALLLERDTSTAGFWTLRARVENRGAESSDLAYFDNNYVLVEAEGGVFLDAEPGEFLRIDLLRDGERGTMQALRAANQVRLSLPLLEGGQVATSGGLRLRLDGDSPKVRISAHFLLADGHDLETEPIDWDFAAR